MDGVNTRKGLWMAWVTLREAAKLLNLSTTGVRYQITSDPPRLKAKLQKHGKVEFYLICDKSIKRFKKAQRGRVAKK